MTRSRSRGRPGFRSLSAYRITSLCGRAAVAAAFLLHALTLAGSSWVELGPGVPAPFVFGLIEGLRYLAVAIEVLGAALLFVPGCTAMGALMLSGTAFVTLFARVFVLGGSPLAAMLLFLLGAAVVGRRRRELVAIWRFHTRPHRPSLAAARR
jgi:hypothetical protein